jgi:hypothetical protein
LLIRSIRRFNVPLPLFPIPRLSSLASAVSYALLQPEKSLTAQLVFLYSVIPGGVRNSRELLEAARRKPVVAAHNAEFLLPHGRVIRLRHDKLGYVSYRVANHIDWTKKEVTLHQGETLSE